MRIGTNHGSLSDRIMSRYGDTPLGMVESALEFLRICEDLSYYNIVLSMKSSNTQVMVQAYRLLVQKLNEEGLKPYPLHLGVTEAGEGEDGRIKSAVGIGTLLEDGLGDTVRVSLTEEPELEAPVAQALIDRYTHRADLETTMPPIHITPKNPYQYERRTTHEVFNIGDHNVPRVIADLSHLKDIEVKDLKSVGHFYLPEPDKWAMNDQGCDFIYSGRHKIPFMLPNGVKEIVDALVWQELDGPKEVFPLFHKNTFLASKHFHPELNFLHINLEQWDARVDEQVQNRKDLVLILDATQGNPMQELRRICFELYKKEITVPVILKRSFDALPDEQLQLYASTDFGGLLIDGFGDGVMLGTEKASIGLDKNAATTLTKCYNSLAFGILQAARTRMTKTEYISCPSCGRTLFDLQETTAMIRKRTDHLKGVKIGIMGCIVNGPGEMADADYGYVGSGKGKITLYRGQDVVKRNVPSESAVDELIELIREDGMWLDPMKAEVE